METPAGNVARFSALGDTLTVSIPDHLLLPGKTASALTLEARFYPRAYKAYSVGNYPVVSLAQWWYFAWKEEGLRRGARGSWPPMGKKTF